MVAGAIIVAAGEGRRAPGELPKQFRPLGGRPVLAWSLDAFSGHPRIRDIVVVAATPNLERARGIADGRAAVVAGGTTRTESVKAGIAALSADLEAVLIHDAARPGLDATVIDAVLDALATAGAAAPALPVVDALKRLEAGRLSSARRDGLFRVQTPQAFHAAIIREALAAAHDALHDDLEAVESLGHNAVLVDGAEKLGKITHPEDFARIETLMGLASPRIRTGSGFDVHAFGAGGRVVLCGVEIAHDQGLEGHSDADVAWHALTDAILGALALGDIGDHFPPSDPQWRGAASEVFLRAAAEMAAQRGWRVANCDVTLICERPKIKPHREAMRARTADVLGVCEDAVSVKATTTEGLGFTGRGEGVAAMAAATLSRST